MAELTDTWSAKLLTPGRDPIDLTEYLEHGVDGGWVVAQVNVAKADRDGKIPPGHHYRIRIEG